MTTINSNNYFEFIKKINFHRKKKNKKGKKNSNESQEQPFLFFIHYTELYCNLLLSGSNVASETLMLPLLWFLPDSTLRKLFVR